LREDGELSASHAGEGECGKGCGVTVRGSSWRGVLVGGTLTSVRGEKKDQPSGRVEAQERTPNTKKRNGGV